MKQVSSASLVYFACILAFILVPWVAQLGLDSGLAYPDYKSNLWRLAWCSHALSCPKAYFDANIFFPASSTLALEDYAPLLQIFFAPVYWLSADPHLAFKVLLVCGLTLNCTAAFVVAHMLLEFEGALIAGAIFGLSPVLLQNSSAPSLVFVFALPFILMYSAKLIESPSWRHWLGLLASLIIQGLCSTQILAIAVASVAVLALTIFFSSYRNSRTSIRTSMKAAAYLTSAGVAAILGLLPFYWPMIHLMLIGTIKQRLGIAAQIGNSADLAALVSLTGQHLNSNHPPITAGIVLLLACYSLKSWRSSPTTIIWCNFLFITLLALGPILKFAGHCLFIPGPFVLLMLMPVYNVMRAPERFLIASGFFAALLAGFGFLQLIRKIEPRRLRLVCTLTVCSLIVFQNNLWAPNYEKSQITTNDLPAIYKWLVNQPPNTACIEFPEQNDRDAMLASVFHWQPLVNGHSSFWPPTAYPYETRIFRELPSNFGFEDLSALGVKYFIARQPKVTGRQWNQLQQLARTRHGQLIGDAILIPIPTAALVRVEGQEIIWSNDNKKITVPAAAEMTIPATLLVRRGNYRNEKPGSAETVQTKWTDQSGRAEVISAQLWMPVAAAENNPEPMKLVVQSPKANGEYDVSIVGMDIHIAVRVQDKAIRNKPIQCHIEKNNELHLSNTGIPTRFLLNISNTGEQQLPSKVDVNFDWTSLLKRETWKSRQSLINGFVSRLGTVYIGVEWKSLEDGHTFTQPEENFPALLLPGQSLPFVFYSQTPDQAGRYEVSINLSVPNRSSDDDGSTISKAIPIATCNAGIIEVQR